ncbi:Pentatricopeptide repeat-containing protein [Platanthera guangdongensis]|uniref:Pentatricopeptide repeat-containing protein n=1 Tax=Platanthera guangdongensis TaxID=2320717 RepID=A0ABR2MNU2_9ASPA
MQRTRKINAEEVGFGYQRPNNITLMTFLPPCAALTALVMGKEIHGISIRNKLDYDIAVGSALVDMYAKCGCLTLSRRLFDKMTKRNAITLKVLIMAYGMNGHGEEALRLFHDMASRREVRPTEITFIAVFAACSHSGLVSEGLELFNRMKRDFGVDRFPTIILVLWICSVSQATQESISAHQDYGNWLRTGRSMEQLIGCLSHSSKCKTWRSIC